MSRATVVGVYRRHNAEVVSRLLASGRRRHWQVALWALDEPAPSLRAETVGSGPGGKFDLLNECLRRCPPDPADFVIAVDDDVTLRRGSLDLLCEIMSRAELGLAQPAHGRGSRSSYEFNRAARLSRARVTTFVEIGPVFAVAPAWQSELLPFPEGMGMGWGLELIWADLMQRGCRLGVVDAVQVIHPEAPTTGYSHEVEEARAQRLMAETGITAMRQAQRVLDVWRPWQRRPAWVAR